MNPQNLFTWNNYQTIDHFNEEMIQHWKQFPVEQSRLTNLTRRLQWSFGHCRNNFGKTTNRIPNRQSTEIEQNHFIVHSFCLQIARIYIALFTLSYGARSRLYSRRLHFKVDKGHLRIHSKLVLLPIRSNIVFMHFEYWCRNTCNDLSTVIKLIMYINWKLCELINGYLLIWEEFIEDNTPITVRNIFLYIHLRRNI